MDTELPLEPSGPPSGTTLTATAGAPSYGRAGRPTCRTAVVVPGGLLSVSGRLDVAAAADVRMALAEALAAGDGDLLLDLSRLTALDATGLGVLVGGHRRAQRAGRVLVLRDVSPAVARLLFLTRLDKVLRTVRTAAVA